MVYGTVICKYAFDNRITLVPWPMVKQIVNILLLFSIECLPVIGKYAFDNRLTLIPWPMVKQIVNILLLFSV
jgi:hypothetical protein